MYLLTFQVSSAIHVAQPFVFRVETVCLFLFVFDLQLQITPLEFVTVSTLWYSFLFHEQRYHHLTICIIK